MKNQDVEENLKLPSHTIYEIISAGGKEELSRPNTSLAWSGIVAGICISFCYMTEAVIKHHLPQSGNFFLIENLGYTIGFLIVILGRFQLFTENTITVILPLLDHFRMRTLLNVARLWGVVLLANMVGTFTVALLISNLPFFAPELFDAFIDISKHAIHRDMGDVFIQAIPAGFIIALLVWMLPSSKGNEIWIIILMTYLIAIGDFAHIVAGSGEAFLLMLNGHASLLEGAQYLVAACVGNIIGGTFLFAFMAYAQVKEEI